jgi:hypothetical protein
MQAGQAREATEIVEPPGRDAEIHPTQHPVLSP